METARPDIYVCSDAERPHAMQEVTCHQCRNIVHISPDSDHCSVCGENLRDLLEPEFVSGYFYERARDTAVSGNLIEALAEAERGLRQQNSTELHLLAAILAQKMERFDDMRNHVAAIPVDDPLRPEGEWLLRSHQENQRAIREQARAGRTSGRRKQAAPASRAGGWQEVINRPAPVTNTSVRQRSRWPRVGAVLGILVAIALSVLIWSPISPPPIVSFGNWRSFYGTEDGASATTTAPARTEDSPASVERSIVTPSATRTPAPAATSAIHSDLVRGTDVPEALVDRDSSRAVSVPADSFDLAAFLRSNGYLELAELPVTARVRGETIFLEGIVHMDVQRRQLLQIAEKIPEVTTVNSVDLMLHPLPSYTVQAGDTLYSIVYDIYGDVRRADEFYEYNEDLLTSRDNIPVGVQLRVPPVN